MVFATDGIEVRFLFLHVHVSDLSFSHAPVLRRRAAAPDPPAPFGTMDVGIVLAMHVLLCVTNDPDVGSTGRVLQPMVESLLHRPHRFDLGSQGVPSGSNHKNRTGDRVVEAEGPCREPKDR